jgi:pimeloyl-ACP methyl ester carboxylesterase
MTIATEMTRALIKTNGITLHVMQAGPEDGPLVILLHGFPEFWYSWRKQIDYLAGQGFRVWSPDQRGYNLSDKPNGIPAYNLDYLADDVIGLIDAAGREKACLVGHDWGGAVTWWTANKYPEKLEKIVILNAPHHSVFARHIRSSRAQMLKSWYFFFFRLPWLPEMVIGLNNTESLVRALKTSSRPGTFTDADMLEYRKAWSQPGAITGMVNWYRTVFQTPPQRLTSRRITVPTLMLWGKKDTVLGAEMAQPSIDLCDNGKLVFFEDATHWIQHEEPDRVNALIGEFLTGANPASPK